MTGDDPAARLPVLFIAGTAAGGDRLANAEVAGLRQKDAPILAAALAAGAELLVTGARVRCGALFGQPIGRLAVLSPADALAAIVHGK